jgi:cobalt/nickel transport system permease protein
MPDYAMEGMNEVVAYILSAIIGVALLVIIFKLASLLVKEKKVSNVA